MQKRRAFVVLIRNDTFVFLENHKSSKSPLSLPEAMEIASRELIDGVYLKLKNRVKLELGDSIILSDNSNAYVSTVLSLDGDEVFVGNLISLQTSIDSHSLLLNTIPTEGADFRLPLMLDAQMDFTLLDLYGGAWERVHPKSTYNRSANNEKKLDKDDALKAIAKLLRKNFERMDFPPMKDNYVLAEIRLPKHLDLLWQYASLYRALYDVQSLANRRGFKKVPEPFRDPVTILRTQSSSPLVVQIIAKIDYIAIIASIGWFLANYTKIKEGCRSLSTDIADISQTTIHTSNRHIKSIVITSHLLLLEDFANESQDEATKIGRKMLRAGEEIYQKTGSILIPPSIEIMDISDRKDRLEKSTKKT